MLLVLLRTNDAQPHSGLMLRTLNNKNTRAQQLVATERYSRIEREAKTDLDPDSVPTHRYNNGKYHAAVVLVLV